MYRYQYVTVEVGMANVLSTDHSLMHRNIISAWAAKGWRYRGYLPTKTSWRGALTEVDLIFELACDDPPARPRIP